MESRFRSSTRLLRIIACASIGLTAGCGGGGGGGDGDGSNPPAGNVPPVARDDQQTVSATVSTVLSILANDSDANNDPLTVTILEQPPGGTVTVSGTTVTFTPNAGAGGPSSFPYRIADPSGATAQATVRLVIGSTAAVIFLADNAVSGVQEIFRWNGFVTEKLSAPLAAGETITDFDAAANGTRIAYATATQGAQTTYKLRAVTVSSPGTALEFTTFSPTTPIDLVRISPDGEHIFFGGRRYAAVARPQQETPIGRGGEGIASFVETRDGQFYYYIGTDAVSSTAAVKRFRIGAFGPQDHEVVVDLEGSPWDFELSPDGQRLVTMTRAFVSQSFPLPQVFASAAAPPTMRQPLHPPLAPNIDGVHSGAKVSDDSQLAYYEAVLQGVVGQIYFSSLASPGTATRINPSSATETFGSPQMASDSRTVYYLARSNVTNVRMLYSTIDQPGIATEVAPPEIAGKRMGRFLLAPDRSGLAVNADEKLFFIPWNSVSTASPISGEVVLNADLNQDDFVYASDGNTVVFRREDFTNPARVYVARPKISGTPIELTAASLSSGARKFVVVRPQ